MWYDRRREFYVRGVLAVRKRFLRTLAGFCAGAVVLCCAGAPGEKAENARAEGKVLAFPGAVGGGKYATGGRGGEVYHVTNLNDSGEGSLRDAVSKSHRVVVFDVSGTIELQGNILVSDSVTIAGQTAPGGAGVTLKNYKLGMSGDNIICRFLSSRPGPYKAGSGGNDAWGGAKGSNSIIDHCSMSWTTDEQWGLYSNNEYYTVQYSIIGPADSWGGHSKGIHGFGMMMGKGYSTFDHNLIVHNVSRNFRGKVSGTETADFTNNVIYNWAYQTAYGTIGHLNYVGNTLKMGAGTTGGRHYVDVDSSTKPENFGIWLAGNRMLWPDGSVYADVTTDNWNGITVKDGLGITKDNLRAAAPFETVSDGENLSTAAACESAEDAYEHVVTFAGNGIAPDLRTAVDKQCAEETRTGTGTHTGTAAYDDATESDRQKIDSYKIQCGVSYTYPEAVLEKTITDTDNDGMPDEWEIARGLNPQDPTDTNGDYCGQGYTNIEYYINDLTVSAFPEGTVTPSPETPMETVSAFETIEAESFAEQNGIQTEECPEGGENIAYIENGDWAMYRGVDFEDGALSFTVRGAGGAAGMELYLDSLDGEPAASVTFPGTDSWQTWESAEFNIPKISGVHSLYLKFTGGEGFLLNVNSFVFGKETLPLNGRFVSNLTVFDSTAPAWAILDSAGLGAKVFGDRDFTFSSFPEVLNGAELIQTACDAKNSTLETVASFTAAADCAVYAGLDTRVETVPDWLAGWEQTDLLAAMDSDTVTFTLYRKELKAGDRLDLGANGQAAYCVNYLVLLTEPEITPTETTTTSAEQTTTTVSVSETTTTTATESLTQTTTAAAPEILLGDFNLDGDVTVADGILLSRAVAGDEAVTVTREQAANGDCDLDGALTLNDIGKILDYLVKTIEKL